MGLQTWIYVYYLVLQSDLCTYWICCTVSVLRFIFNWWGYVFEVIHLLIFLYAIWTVDNWMEILPGSIYPQLMNLNISTFGHLFSASVLNNCWEMISLQVVRVTPQTNEGLNLISSARGCFGHIVQVVMTILEVLFCTKLWESIFNIDEDLKINTLLFLLFCKIWNRN